MCSTSPVRTPKLELAAKQPLTEECWIPPKNKTKQNKTKPYVQEQRRSPSKSVGGAKSCSESNLIPTPVFLPGEPHGQWSLVGYGPWGCRVRHD